MGSVLLQSRMTVKWLSLWYHKHVSRTTESIACSEPHGGVFIIIAQIPNILSQFISITHNLHILPQ